MRFLKDARGYRGKYSKIVTRACLVLTLDLLSMIMFTNRGDRIEGWYMDSEEIIGDTLGFDFTVDPTEPASQDFRD
jgi:hypothetical protein